MKSVMDAIGATTKAVKTLKNIDDRVKLNEAISGVQESLLSAQQIALENQQEMTAVIQAKSAAEEEIASLRAFDAEKARYEMHETEAGGITYRVKEEARNGEPSHHICANCYESSIKSVLQHKGLNLNCVKCGSSAKYEPRISAGIAL